MMLMQPVMLMLVIMLNLVKSIHNGDAGRGFILTGSSCFKNLLPLFLGLVFRVNQNIWNDLRRGANIK